MQTFHNGINGILDNQTAMNKTQQQVSSGRRVLTPADDPVASTKILQLQQDISLRDQFEKNMTAADNRLQLEEASLKGITENLQRIRELTVQAGNGSTTLTDRQAIATEIDQLLDATVTLMNTKDASNEYIFAGFKGETLPFQTNTNGRFDFKGDEGQRYLSLSETTNVATSNSGKELFVDIPTVRNSFVTRQDSNNEGVALITSGYVVDQEKFEELFPDDLVIEFQPDDALTPPTRNFTVRRASDNRVVEGMANVPYDEGTSISAAGTEVQIKGKTEAGDRFFIETAPKQSLTDTIQRLTHGLNRLGDNPTDAATRDQLLEDSLANLDNAFSSISQVRSDLGARLNVVANMRELAADVDLVSKKVLSELSDVDLAEAVSRLSQETLLLEVSQQSFATISRLSLFNQL